MIFLVKNLYITKLLVIVLVSSSLNSFLLEKKIDIKNSSQLLIKNYISHPYTSIQGVKKINPCTYSKLNFPKIK